MQCFRSATLRRAQSGCDGSVGFEQQQQLVTRCCPVWCRQHLQLLVCDLLLQTHTVVWEQRPGAPPQLAQFQQTLACLRAVSVRLPSALSRVFLHEATVRMMAGAAPGRTQQLLERSLRHRGGRNYSVLCGEWPPPHTLLLGLSECAV